MKERRRIGDDLTGRRHGYDQLKGELHHFFRRIWFVVILIGVTSTLGLTAYGFVIQEVQQQRYDACVDQNIRHDNTEVALRAAAADDEEKAPTEKAKAEVRRRRDVTVGLIDALSPVQNCDEIVEQGFDAYWPW